ncbi:hypothetical protein Atai01_28700 [Amycolatopsis taiwanensis]|uniref:Uncharacterized protein n=1 Tax=Amycolatopsis taiwanensis TaxID=342230 RepID=A0A9W6QYA9_9PSEU|nr:hypothetical protein Atai01_28700 [Amycolatopsis taiwanensis]
MIDRQATTEVTAWLPAHVLKYKQPSHLAGAGGKVAFLSVTPEELERHGLGPALDLRAVVGTQRVDGRGTG